MKVKHDPYNPESLQYEVVNVETMGPAESYAARCISHDDAKALYNSGRYQI